MSSRCIDIAAICTGILGMIISVVIFTIGIIDQNFSIFLVLGGAGIMISLELIFVAQNSIRSRR